MIGFGNVETRCIFYHQAREPAPADSPQGAGLSHHPVGMISLAKAHSVLTLVSCVGPKSGPAMWWETHCD